MPLWQAAVAWRTSPHKSSISLSNVFCDTQPVVINTVEINVTMIVLFIIISLFK